MLAGVATAAGPAARIVLVNGPHVHLVIDAGERLDTRALAPACQL